MKGSHGKRSGGKRRKEEGKKSDDPRFVVPTNSPLNYGGINALLQSQKGHS